MMHRIFYWLFALLPFAAFGQSPIPNDPFLSVPAPSVRQRPVEPAQRPAPPQAARNCSTSETLPNMANLRWTSGTYLAFFDWNSEELTVRAQQIAREAVAFARNRNTRVIEINGHDDNSQSEFRAMALSQRRANAVADALVRLGWPLDRMCTAAFGSTQPLVPTNSGLRQPENRRVEIIVRYME
jgi:outer membrane protein OmpA-like peptidoglycan-associated protein